MARPSKEIHRIGKMISCYEKDVKFINDHRGNLDISRYVIEACYHFAGSTSRIESFIIEIGQLKKEISKLKEELRLEKFKNKKHDILSIDACTNTDDLEKSRIEYFIKQNISKSIEGIGIDDKGWNTISSRNLLLFPTGKIAKDWCLNYHKKIKNKVDAIKIMEVKA